MALSLPQIQFVLLSDHGLPASAKIAANTGCVGKRGHLCCNKTGWSNFKDTKISSKSGSRYVRVAFVSEITLVSLTPNDYTPQPEYRIAKDLVSGLITKGAQRAIRSATVVGNHDRSSWPRELVDRQFTRGGIESILYRTVELCIQVLLIFGSMVNHQPQMPRQPGLPLT